jgi:hypothetical protein
MICLSRPYLMMPRSTAVDLLESAGARTDRLDLDELHAELRRHSVDSQDFLDRTVIVEDRDAAPLSEQLQADFADLIWGGGGRASDGRCVIPRSIAVLKLPDLARAANADLARHLGRVEGLELVVLDDASLSDAIAVFNRRLRDRVRHGFSPRLLHN